MWDPYATEYETSMHEMTGTELPSRGRVMYMKQQAGQGVPRNLQKQFAHSQKLTYNEAKPVMHTSQTEDHYDNPRHMAEDHRPKRRTTSPSRPKVQSRELITGKRGSRAAEMFTRAREHTDEHVIDQEKVKKRVQARGRRTLWETSVPVLPIGNMDISFDEPVFNKFQFVTGPTITRKGKPQMKKLEQTDYNNAYSNGYRTRVESPWRNDSERLKRFHSEVEPYKMNYNRAPKGWGSSSQSSDMDVFDLGSLDVLPPTNLDFTKTKQGALRDFNARPKSWMHEDDEYEPVMSSCTVRSRRVQFEAQSKPRRNDHPSSLKVRHVAGPKKWADLPESGDL